MANKTSIAKSLKAKLNTFEKKQYAISFVALILFLLASVLINRLHLKSIAEEHTRFISRMINIGDFREATLILNDAKLSSFEKIQYISDQPNRSFVFPPKAEFFSDTGLWNSISTDSMTIPVKLNAAGGSTDKITFDFNRFGLTPYALLFWFILNIVSIPQTRYLKRKMVEQFNKDLKDAETQQKLQTELSTWMNQCEEKDLVCKQIHHDLASPLGLLKVSIQRLGDQSLAKAFALSLDRISKISEDLKSQKYIWASENPKLETAQSTLNTILEEKRLLTSKFKIKFNVKATQNALNQTIDIPVGQLHRVLSNILNNAIEAVRPLGTINVLVRYSNKKMDLIITDSGSGIAKEHADQIFEKQKSFNKPQGSGLGLYHAKLCIESFGGKLTLLNTKRVRKHGAAFLLRLPVSRM